MVQSLDSLNKPMYSAVNIHITKPEVNSVQKAGEEGDDNGVYNSVKIDIDNPTANTYPKVYDYPQAEEVVTYDMVNPQVNIPKGLIESNTAYNSSIPTQEDENIPKPNYTTLDAEKENTDGLAEKKTLDELKTAKNVRFRANENNIAIKRPEIIPSEDIKPEVDIDLVISNLENEDFDIQAQQLEEIVRKGLDNQNSVKPYVVKDVISPILNIIKKDTSNLVPPTQEQIETRKKIITNYVVQAIAKEQKKDIKPPFELTEKDMAAEEITPFEQAERNKGYAIEAMAVLSKKYIDDIEQENGSVVPFTDIPGISEIVDTLRYSYNSKSKIAALDALRYIGRPEYKKEMNLIFTIVQADKDPKVAAIARGYAENIKDS